MKKTILLVDDSKPILFLFEAILSRHYEIVTANDGMAAMDWLAQGNLPDLIISDVQMPYVTGWELAQHLSSSAIYGHIPMIILSATDENEIIDKCKEYGIADYLAKPFNPTILLQKVEKVLSAEPAKKKIVQIS